MVHGPGEEKLQSAQPLLRDDRSTSVDSEDLDRDLEQPELSPCCSSSRRRLWNSTRLWSYIHAVLIILYSTIFIGALFRLRTQDNRSSGTHLPLPAREALKPELRHFPTSLEDNPFAGAPREELHKAWHNLLKNDNIRLPKSNIEALDLHSVYVRNSSDGIASLSVYHALHCVKKMREMMYKEYYHTGKSEIKMQRETRHADHCVEYIREALMCKPDLSLVTFRWINNTSQHPDEPDAFYPTNFDSGLHECSNWESLDSWAEQRVFNLYMVDLLDRPES